MPAAPRTPARRAASALALTLGMYLIFEFLPPIVELATSFASDPAELRALWCLPFAPFSLNVGFALLWHLPFLLFAAFWGWRFGGEAHNADRFVPLLVALGLAFLLGFAGGGYMLSLEGSSANAGSLFPEGRQWQGWDFGHLMHLQMRWFMVGAPLLLALVALLPFDAARQ